MYWYCTVISIQNVDLETVVCLPVLLKISIKSREVNEKGVDFNDLHILRKASDHSGLKFFFFGKSFNSRIDVFRKSLLFKDQCL